MLKWVSSQQTISTTNKANNFNRNIVIVCGGLAITIGIPIAVYLMHRRRNNRHFRKEETNRRLEDNKVQAESRNSTPLIVQQNNSIIEGQQQMETTTIHHVEEKQQEAKMVDQSAANVVYEETKKKVEGGTMQPESTVVNVLTKPAMEVEVDGGADKQQNCEVNESGGGGQMELVKEMSATGTPTKMLTQQPPPSSSTTTTSTPTVEKQHRLASLLDFILEQPQTEFNWAEAVEEAEESRKEFESSNQQGKEEELKLEKQNSVVSDKMMNGIGQQQQMRHQEGKSPKAGMYSGRNSSSSSQRQHPVNGICTCNRCMQTLNDLQSARGYKNAESPHSTHSEGSADSGRATGPLNSSSPFAIDEFGQQQATEILPIYEFEVPNTLVGLIIGIQGKTIRELCIRANVRMLIRPHHTPSKYDTHQICSVEGRRDDINKCLHMIRFRFPPCRFPDLNLKPVLPPPPTTTITARGTPTALTLPVGVPCEVYISAHVDAGHFFLQLPTHPSFSSLAILDQYMLSVYTQPGGAPEIPKPCKVGVLCTAPAYNGWFRAITLAYEPEQDEVLVRFVDYGGFARLPRADLRQIRTDFMNLPMQAIECYLANVQPIDGTSHWSEKANELFQQLCVSKIIQAALLGYCKHDGLPCVELYVLDENKKTVRVDQMLLERGLAKPADPTILIATNSSMSNSSASC